MIWLMSWKTFIFKRAALSVHAFNQIVNGKIQKPNWHKSVQTLQKHEMSNAVQYYSLIHHRSFILLSNNYTNACITITCASVCSKFKYVLLLLRTPVMSSVLPMLCFHYLVKYERSLHVLVVPTNSQMF